MYKIIRHFLKICGVGIKYVCIIGLSLVVLIAWAWVRSEEEKYVMPLEVSTGMQSSIAIPPEQDDITFEYTHNEARIIGGSSVDYLIENLASITTVVKGKYSDEGDTRTLLAIAYSNGDLEFYRRVYDTTDTSDLAKDVLHLDYPVVAMTFLDTTLILLTLNERSYIDVHWVRYVNNTWVHTDRISTPIQLSYIDTIFPLGTKGGFIIDNRNDMYFIDANRKVIQKKRENVISMHVMGDQKFYVLHYLTEHGTQYIEVNIADDAIVFESDIYSREVLHRDSIELVAVHEHEKAFTFSFFDTLYTVNFP